MHNDNNELPSISDIFGGIIPDTKGVIHDEFADFVEFEDENGVIQIIKYDTQEYNFRGNKYCLYTIGNETTRVFSEGIAQINNGKYIHIKEQDGVEQIKKHIREEKRQLLGIKNLRYALKENYVVKDSVNEDFLEKITAKTQFQNAEYWLFIRNKFITEEKKYVVFNATKFEVVKDDTLINQLFDFDKYFPEIKNQSPNNQKKWWKLW